MACKTDKNSFKRNFFTILIFFHSDNRWKQQKTTNVQVSIKFHNFWILLIFFGWLFVLTNISNNIDFVNIPMINRRWIRNQVIVVIKPLLKFWENYWKIRKVITRWFESKIKQVWYNSQTFTNRFFTQSCLCVSEDCHLLKLKRLGWDVLKFLTIYFRYFQTIILLMDIFYVTFDQKSWKV